jgi:germination protein YpeB
MIYDGPFSDGVLNQEIKGLKNETCNEASAREYLSLALKDFAVTEITSQGKTTGKFVTYNFIVKADNIIYYAQVTEQGKFLINLSGNVGDGEIVYSEENAIKTAENFAKNLALENMKCVWKATSKNITYVNLAPVNNGIIYYPDLIKVKVDRTNGNIMGWEATNYAYNHTTRNNGTFAKSEDEILASVSSKISVNSLKKCIIPLEYGGESYAYEICGKYNTFTYYIYIDANTAKQIKVMRVIQTTDGELLL